MPLFLITNMKQLKSYWMLVLFIPLLASCTSKQKETTTNSDDTLQQLYDAYEKKSRYDSVKIAGYSKYPFGSPTLIRFSFSDEWNIIDRSGNTNLGHSIYHKALLEINDWLSEMNHNGYVIPTPPFKQLQHVHLEKGDPFCKEYLKTDSIIYALEPIGPYKTYYVFGNFMNDYGEEAEYTPDHCAEFGNLLLIDSLTQEAKILNIYRVMAENDDVNLRLFYIDEQKNIHLREIYCDPFRCKITRKFIVSIDATGNIFKQKI